MKRIERYASKTDAELILLYQQGDELAGEALFYHYHMKMLHYAAVIVGIFLADDVMQDAWEAVIKGLRNGSYREEQLFNKYIKGIVHRRALVTLKEERRFGMTDAEPEESEDEAMNAEEAMIKQQSEGIMARALRRVGKRAARILVLHLVIGKSFKEICVIMHISTENIVRAIYSRTLREISLLLAPYRGIL